MAIVEPIAESAIGRRRLRLANPASLAPLGEIEVANAGDVAQAVERARKAQPDWARTSFRERQRLLERAVRLLVERQDECQRHGRAMDTGTGVLQSAVYRRHA